MRTLVRLSETSSLASLLVCAALALGEPRAAQVGTVKWEQKLGEGVGGFGGQLDIYDYFGVSLAFLGDLDDDGVTDLAVGALGDDDGGTQKGAVWILFLNADGTVRFE